VRLPYPGWEGAGDDAANFAAALGNSWRIVLASLVAYCVGDLVDDRIFRRLRERSQKKYGDENIKGFAFRALFSSLIGHILDTNIFVFIAFAFIMPWDALPGMIILGIIIKWAYEWAVIPVTFRVAKWVRAKENSYSNERS